MNKEYPISNDEGEEEYRILSMEQGILKERNEQ